MASRGLVVSPVLFDGATGAAAPIVVAAAPASLFSDALTLDWRALFGASAVRHIQASWPQATLTSFVRSPARNARVGGRPDSLHLVGLASDFTIPARDRVAFLDWLRASWPAGADIVDEGDHVHIEWEAVRVTPLARIILGAVVVVVGAVLLTR